MTQPRTGSLSTSQARIAIVERERETDRKRERERERERERKEKKRKREREREREHLELFGQVFPADEVDVHLRKGSHQNLVVVGRTSRHGLRRQHLRPPTLLHWLLGCCANRQTNKQTNKQTGRQAEK